MTTKSFELLFLNTAELQIRNIERDHSRQELVKQIKKALRNLAENPNILGLSPTLWKR